MSLQNEDGAQWFKKGWERGRPQSLSEAVFDEYQPEPEPLWNSPCTPPDAPGMYRVMTGAYWDDNKDTTVEMAGHAHWNGQRWSRPFGAFTSRAIIAGRSDALELRAFNPRQDYPWREVAA